MSPSSLLLFLLLALLSPPSALSIEIDETDETQADEAAGLREQEKEAAQKDDNNNNNTVKCNAREYGRFVDDQALCYLDADLAVNQAVEGLNGGGNNNNNNNRGKSEEDHEKDKEAIRKAVCQAIEAKVKCIETNVPKCYNATSTSNIRNNFLIAEFDKTSNTSGSMFDEAFIDGCQILKDSEAEVTKLVTGTSTCRFHEFRQAYADWNGCQEKALNDRNSRMSLQSFVSDRRALFVRAQCAFRKSILDDCRVPYMRCLGQELQAKLVQKEEAAISDLEEAIRANMHDFSFEKACKEEKEEEEKEEVTKSPN